MPSIYYKNYKSDPAGTLSCGGSTQNSITLNYTYTNATTNLGIYNNQSLVGTIDIDESGSGSGEYTVGGLSSGTSYTYKLIHGNNVNEQLLAETQCSTQAGSSGGGGGGGWSSRRSYWIYVDPNSPSSEVNFEIYNNAIVRFHGSNNDTANINYYTRDPDTGNYLVSVQLSGMTGPGWISVYGSYPYGAPNTTPSW